MTRRFRPEMVIFDCDGVLIDSEIISAQMLRDEARLWGVNLAIEHILENYVGRSYPTVLAEIQTEFKITLPKDFEEKYRARLLSAFDQKLRILSGVREVIENIAVPYCVGTSSSLTRVNFSLNKVELMPFFRGRIFTSSQVARGKPAPDLFEFAARQMGVEPSSCMVIEDSRLGVEAGRAAGMYVLRFTGGSHILDPSDGAGADFVFDKFEKFFDHYPELKRG